MEFNKVFTFLTLLLFLCFLPSPVSSSITFTSATSSSAVLVRDSAGESLISDGGVFQLGFFTPNRTKLPSRYLGIWYRNHPSVIVWVANREMDLPDTTGFLCFTPDGNLQVLDGTTTTNDSSYWSTDLKQLTVNNYTLSLLNSGNLILYAGNSMDVLWQSFDNPTDTFLPGMKMVSHLNLSSWNSPDDPSTGDYLFLTDETMSQILNNSIPFWNSADQIGSCQLPNFVVEFLSNSSSNPLKLADINPPRLVMGFDGRIQFFETANQTSPSWITPTDICSLVAPCGSFGSCNGGFRVPCKCLPGFVPKSVENWETGDFSEGCKRVSQTCQNKKDGSTSFFLKLKVVKVQRETGLNGDFDEEYECREWCLGNCNCQGYSFDHTTACRFWTDDLKDIVEINGSSAAQGTVDLNVRVSISDIELTRRDCKPCGTNTIPYPLSTGPTCGDPMYSSFTCNNSTGLLTFHAINASYPVTRIDRWLHKFFIQVNDEYCSEPNVIELDRSLPFTTNDGKCNAEPVNLKLARFQGGKVSKEMEIVWEPPSEPLCSSEEDCQGWLNSSCREVNDGTGDYKRCLCSGNSRWVGVNATCQTNVLSNHVGSSSSKRRRLLLYSIVFGILGGVLIMSLATVILQMKRKRRKDVQALTESKYEKEENLAFRLYDGEKRVKEFMNSTEFGEDDKKDIDVPFFDLECILSATNFFCHTNKLGQGGFGPVFKGKFPGGQEIAVKRLSSGSTQGLEEFKNEVILIAKLQHRNLVRLLGFCVEGSEKMLLYEYMPNKSLDSFIFDRSRSVLLNWEVRFNIIMGIARGMLYLHHDSRLTIVHRDLKTSNVLLDEDMNPKISDFGMARIVAAKQTEVDTVRVVGTYGYMSPEYALDGKFSTKSDVFSFGIVVLEILIGRKNTGFYKSEDGISLASHAWGKWREGNLMEVMEQSLLETCDSNEFTRCAIVALLCLQEDPSDRPTMADVVFMLGSDASSLTHPKEPAFSVRNHAATAPSTSVGTMEITTELQGR